MLSTFYPGDTLHRVGQPSFVLVQVKLLNTSSSNSTSLSPPMMNLSSEEGHNIFGELETIRSTNWQYELHQLQQSNERLREQLEKFSNPNKKRKKVVYSMKRERKRHSN